MDFCCVTNCSCMLNIYMGQKWMVHTHEYMFHKPLSTYIIYMFFFVEKYLHQNNRLTCKRPIYEVCQMPVRTRPDMACLWQYLCIKGHWFWQCTTQKLMQCSEVRRKGTKKKKILGLVLMGWQTMLMTADQMKNQKWKEKCFSLASLLSQ